MTASNLLGRALLGLVATFPLATPDAGAAPNPRLQEDGAEAEEAPAWDVDNPPGPRQEQVIDTEEGTWMSLDVSPDGSTIAFDLLGDLYLLPIEGGTPTRITQGIAWDMQPRFSPDGKSIAFTSDRTGKNKKAGDNIWVVDVDGENLRQITEETFRLLNGPAWTPDGEYIVARKHFTSRRSLGSGEMWLYHRSGVEGGVSGGLQLTTKRTDQKDVNEPVFDPTGRYLYYSEDATPGQTFEYDKDSNKQIYVIQRLDREENKTETLISGPGGACRPTPSPDGKVIAFVRRVGEKTGLHLFDANSGAVKLLYDDLERDMQEAWAIHGVYPTMAWTPDGRSIVFWARGKIRRIDVLSKEVTVIPFHVNDTREVTPALRFPIDVETEMFDVKMLRWVQVSPDGKRVAYQALGSIFLRDLETGHVTRMTEADDRFEFCPSFSADGDLVVYTTWNDESLGEVRVHSLLGGANRALTTEPGHYRDPCFSPDGETVVYVKSSGGYLVSPLYSGETGVYRVALDNEEPVRITRSGSKPQFGAASDRVFLTRSESDKDADNAKLFSIGLDGKDERAHFTSTWATDYRVSPDGKWIAFVERFNVYLAPFVATGREVSVSPESTAFPVAKASSEAGEWVHFSGDSQTLFWSLGPKLYRRPLTDSFAFLAGAPEKLPEPVAEGEDISFRVPHDRPEHVLALSGGRAITMSGDQIIEDSVVLIRGNRIAEVGARGAVNIPADATVLNITGQTVLPGYVDTHAHGGQGSGGVIPQQNWVDYARLAFGVTTVHDPSNDTGEIFAASELTKAGRITAPRTFSTGTILYGATGSFKAEVDSLDDARFHLRRMQAVGAFSVKSYNQPRRDQRQQVIAAARELGMMVVPEGGSTFMHNLNQIVDGHTGIEHTLSVELVYDDVLDLWRRTGVGYTPTLGVAYGGLGGENYWYQVDDVWRNERIQSFIPADVVVPRARRRSMAPQEDYNHFRCARITKQVIDNGGSVQAGGHGQLNGICTHWEMWMFVQGGMTPFEALRSGTLQGAQYIGIDHQLGSLEKGKLADVLVLEKGRDPLANIRDTEHIEYVIANGRLFNARTMDQVAPDNRPRRPFYYEADGFSPSLLPPAHTGCHGCGRGGADAWARH